MDTAQIIHQLQGLALGETCSFPISKLARIEPEIPDEDEFDFANRMRERIRDLCAVYRLYSLEIDQEGPVEDPIEFRKIPAT